MGQMKRCVHQLVCVIGRDVLNLEHELWRSELVITSIHCPFHHDPAATGRHARGAGGSAARVLTRRISLRLRDVWADLSKCAASSTDGPAVQVRLMNFAKSELSIDS
jgi:hypothetical protein